jgi:hypothetical protein
VYNLMMLALSYNSRRNCINQQHRILIFNFNKVMVWVRDRNSGKNIKLYKEDRYKAHNSNKINREIIQHTNKEKMIYMKIILMKTQIVELNKNMKCMLKNIGKIFKKRWFNSKNNNKNYKNNNMKKKRSYN